MPTNIPIAMGRRVWRSTSLLHVTRGCTQSHADADLSPPTADEVGDDAVDTDGRQAECEQT